MKGKIALVSILVLLFLSAFSQKFRPLFALPLPEGRTLDEGHDSGFIDWSGSVGYVNLNHKDGICPSGCWEQVTRISNGGAVSGAFAPVDVVYFEVMVAFTHNSGAGTAVLNACGSSAAWYLYVGPGSGLPGFVSMSVPVPPGCTSWSLSASGGYVDFRSVDANYVSPPPPISTNTFTPLPTATFTPSPTATQTPAPTDMFTPTLTATETPTATETLAPGVTPSDTPSPTLTSTPSATLPPGVTPSDTPVPTDTPIPPAPTNTPVQPPSGGGQGGSGGFVLPTATATPTTLQPTFTHTPVTAFGIVSVTPNLVETARVMIFGTSTPTPTPRAASGAGKSGSSFPWWLLAAGGAAAYAVSKRKQIAANLTKGQKGGARLSASPSGDCPWWNLICQWKAKKRLEELIKQTNGNGAEAIISIMGDTNLPGQNAQKRLDWVLRHTRGGLIRQGKYQGHSGSGWTPFGQFKYHFGLDDGLAPGFQDSWLYCNWLKTPAESCKDQKIIEKYRSESNQIGHFLSAVDMANRGKFGLRLTVAHEKWGDTFPSGLAQQLFATVVPDGIKQPINLNIFGRHITIPNPLKKYDLGDSLNYWSEAQAYDKLYLQTGDPRYRQLRDQELRRILGDTASLRKSKRKGNSLADLRLSLRGFEFNDWIEANPKASPSQTAEQLRRLIASDRPQSGTKVDKHFPRPIPR